tara:strand:+ start:307 stop:468 length:162 start_codon:yes stop_codon:yes gene_type:complete
MVIVGIPPSCIKSPNEAELMCGVVGKKIDGFFYAWAIFILNASVRVTSSFQSD